ncbi:hypothetical protein MRX96_041206 [Rhipicephalus microplus]
MKCCVVDGRHTAFCCAQNGPIYNAGLALPPALYADRDGHEATARAWSFGRRRSSSFFLADEDDGARGPLFYPSGLYAGFAT